jgi:hypothetical protein
MHGGVERHSKSEEYDALLPFICDGIRCGHRAFHVVAEEKKADHVIGRTHKRDDSSRENSDQAAQGRMTCHSLVCRGYAGSDRVVSATSNLASIMRARYLGSFTIPTRSAAPPLITDASLDAIPRSNNRSCPIVILTPGCPFPTAGKLLFVKVQQNRTSGIAHRETRTAGRCRCWSMCRHRGRPSRTVPGVDI